MRKNAIVSFIAVMLFTGICVAQTDTIVLDGQKYFYLPAAKAKEGNKFSSGRFNQNNRSKDTSAWNTSPSLTEGDPNDGKNGATDASLPVVVLPSPDNVGLVRGISDDVDLYTGKLNVSIPVYTAKGRSIEIPITVHMSAGAQKVNDIGSWVGLGNHLSTGGSITRVMKNLPDEFSENVSGNRNISPSFNFPGVGYLSIKNSQHGSIRLERFGTPPSPMVAYTPGEKRDIILKGSWAVKKNHPDKGFDLQPDEFHFNFGQYSGKFSFDQDGNVIFSSESNLKVTPTISNGKIINFIVLTDDGYKYEFGGYNLNAVEESQQLNFSKSILYTYLADGDNQNFLCASNNGTYNGQDLLGTGNVSIPGEWMYKYVDFNLVMAWDLPQVVCAGPSYCIQTPTHLMDFSDPLNTYFAEFPFYPSTWYLTKITSPVEETAILNYVDNGQLNYLSNRSFNSNAPISASSYGSGYSFASGCTSPLNSFAAPREFLPVPMSHYPSFGENSISATQIKVNSKRISSIDLADGTKVRFFANTLRTDLPGDKRLDNIKVEKDGVVIKEFAFDFDNIQSAEPFESRVYSYKRGNYIISPGNGNAEFLGITLSDMSSTQTGAYLEVDNGVKNRMYLKSITEKGQLSSSLPPFTFEYYNQQDLSFRTSVNQDVYGYTKTTGVPSSTLPPLEKLKAGVLKKIVYPTGGYKEYVYEISGNSLSWNGLRVSQIKEMESVMASPILKNYSYGTYTPTDRGDLFYRLPDVVDIYNTKVITLMEKGFSSETNRINPESETRGAVGGYSYAEVSQPGNGKFHIDFTTGSLYPDTGVPSFFATNYNGGTNANISNVGFYYPYPQQISNDWQRGLPVSEYTKSESGADIKSTFYEYDFGIIANGNGNSPAVQASRYQPYSGVPGGWVWALYGHYIHYPKWRVLKKKTDREYDQNGITYTDIITDYTNNKFSFNGRDYMYPVSVKTTGTSRNEIMTQNMKYPLDYSATTDDFGLGISYLKTKNKLNAPVEQYSFLQNSAGGNTRYISGLLTKYHADNPMPKEVFKLKTDGLLTSFTPSNTGGSVFNKDINYKSELQFPVYDATGRVLQQNKTNDISEAYKWGYNKLFPIAKAMNANASEIDYTSFEPGCDYYSAGSSINQPVSAISGTYIKRLNYAENFDFGTIAANKEYKLTFWQGGTNPNILRMVGGSPTTLGTPQTLKTVNGWNLIQVTIPAISAVSSVRMLNATDPGSNAYIDEVRLYPANAQMLTYAFTPLVGMISETDVNNKTTFYEYDGIGRLSVIKDDNKHIVKTICYNYAGLPVTCPVNSIAPCIEPEISSVTHSGPLQVTVSYTVPPSTTSCRIELRTADDVVVGFLNSPSCTSPAVINVSGIGYFYAYVIAYSAQCPAGTSSQPVGVRVKF